MGSSTSLLEAIAEFAAQVSPDAVAAVVEQLRSVHGAATSWAAMLPIQQRLHATARAKFERVITEWEQQTNKTTLAEVAASIEGALYQAIRLRAETSIELVWSGPTHPTSGLRSTEQVLLELIDAARRSLFIVTFAAYKVDRLVNAIESATERGVRVVFILESRDESAGKVTFDPGVALALSRLTSVTSYGWPTGNRQRNSQGQHGSLHAKFLVADEETLFVSSANLTDYAMNLNVELGTLVRGGDAPRQAAANLSALIQQGVFRLASGFRPADGV
ncbi:DISARM system phospholipase D-like protein DrmC [Paraburkholderia sp. MM5482-R1]|uniref:DISARM system phospholipase D-like protein DrmC n=1 Tax=unclassified Paraburkholderia TaxID=2615204 RepID=UPI003D1FC9D0